MGTDRFNRSIKEECFDRVIPLGETHLRELVRECVAHYHEERGTTAPRPEQ
jgi:hypothetical protein